jgi:hypothetical protein
VVEPSGYVLDATVAAKWYLQDEEMVSEARRVRDAFSAGDIRLIGSLSDHPRACERLPSSHLAECPTHPLD